MEHTRIQIHKLMQGQVSPAGTLPIIEEELQNHIQKTKLKISGRNSELVDKYFIEEVLIRDRLQVWVNYSLKRNG